MAHMLSFLRRSLRKSPRVADDIDSGAVNFDGARARREQGGINDVIMRLPFLIISCFAVPRVKGTDGLWLSGDYTSASEVNHLMVSDGMRYSILM
ncbi:unnamed protein product [Cochlearia groenlandica]